MACAGCGGEGGGGPAGSPTTRTPIKHLIIVIPENRSFDSVFATYTPAAGETIWNLLSMGIVRADGPPGTRVRRHKAAHTVRCRIPDYDWRSVYRPAWCSRVSFRIQDWMRLRKNC